MLKGAVLSMNIVFPAAYILARWLLVFPSFFFFLIIENNRSINDALLLTANKGEEGCAIRFT